MRMTLDERLKELPDEEFVYIGCYGASNFIAINKVKRIRKDLENDDKKVIDDYEKQIKKYEGVKSTLPKQIENTREKIKNAASQHSHDYFIGLLESKINNLAKAERRLPEIKARKKAFIPFIERDVVEEYHHSDTIEGTTLLISGEDWGRLWWFGEHSDKTLEELLDECQI